LRDGGVPFDDAHPMTGRTKLIGGGDADDPAANDNDIHG
jgi:hypothetical protein